MPDDFAADTGYCIRRHLICAQPLQPLFERSVDVCDQAFTRSIIPDRAIKFSCIHAADSRDTVFLHDISEACCASEIGRLVIVFVHDQRSDRGLIRLIVLVGHAIVTYQWIGHNNGLVRVGRIGEDLLVADHGGVEYDLKNLVLHVAESIAAVF